MGFWIIGTEHLTSRQGEGITQGVNFNGITDKKTAPMPNEGNRCAFEKCGLGYGIAEGSAARFALVGIANQWCHKECAERWEMEVRSGIGTPVPQEKALCGAPHPEIVGASCDREEHPGGNHMFWSAVGNRINWYMEPAEVARLKANIVHDVPPDEEIVGTFQSATLPVVAHVEAEAVDLADKPVLEGTPDRKVDGMVLGKGVIGRPPHPDVAIIDAAIEESQNAYEAELDEDPVPPGYSEPLEPEVLAFTSHDIGSIVSKMHLENQAMRQRLAELDPKFDLEAAIKERS